MLSLFLLIYEIISQYLFRQIFDGKLTRVTRVVLLERVLQQKHTTIIKKYHEFFSKITCMRSSPFSIAQQISSLLLLLLYIWRLYIPYHRVFDSSSFKRVIDIYYYLPLCCKVERILWYQHSMDLCQLYNLIIRALPN